MRKLKQIPLRLEEELYKDVKRKLVDIDRSFNNYIIQLIKKDLKREDKE